MSDMAKEQMVLVILQHSYYKDKKQYVLCKTMEDAKRLFPGKEKRLVSIIE